MTDRCATRATALRLALLASTAFLAAAGTGIADPMPATGFIPGTLVVSRIQYDPDTNPARTGEGFPAIFNDPTVSGLQGSIFLDSYGTRPHSRRLASFALTDLSASGTPISSSFSSKSEGALHLSADGHYLTYMGYVAAPGAENVPNTETTALSAETSPVTIPSPPPAAPYVFDRAVALVKFDGTFSVTPESNAFSGDNPRGAITADGQEFYMVGNADKTLQNGIGPATTIGVRFGTPGSTSSIELGTYTATDRPEESAKKHIKDSNWRSVGIFNGNLYISKGSGSNGDDGIFQVMNGTADGLPAGGTTNEIVQLLGERAKNPVTGATSPLKPFGFWFANPTTLYVADEGNPTDGNGNLISDPLAGLQKWVLIDKVWTLEYVIRDGLEMGRAVHVPGYPVATYTTGLRNMTGRVNDDGTVTVYAITAQTSSISGGEPDPTRLVAVTDSLDATALPSDGDGDHRGFGRDETRHLPLDRFVTLQASRPGEVFRGVAFAPAP